ncbi:TIGR04219 family outer membrane beta-barrel protein [Aliivibrio sifiae]|uniref:Iron-hydroxamate ABC transporter substrate-binding protein n=1 Tax=Aliivibrio sifiae TaxID=566293 RepID=A0A2S7X4Y8_9GAMM|nr:TIGR04219 family outer membrane beta-barrel protein [Aliivibrio sifiae]PQJ85276.1 hypothetical protein BTO23_18320 [Aliivibrio sifiae]GLR76600.1 hypothetical protein GCM10007855_34750 [Aliivibrio sifiae]
MNKLSLATVVASAALVLAAPAHSTEKEFTTKVAIYAWFPDGKVGSKDGAVRDNDVDASQAFSIAFEHPYPYIPNVKVRYTPVKADRFEYDQIDYTGYYKLLDTNGLQFDVGLTLMQFANGEFNKGGSVDSNKLANQSFDETALNMYADASMHIPNTNFHIFGQYDFGSSSDTRTMDGQAGVKYILPVDAVDVEFKVGYRVMDHEFGYFEGFDSDQANVMVDGWFGGLSFDF